MDPPPRIRLLVDGIEQHQKLVDRAVDSIEGDRWLSSSPTGQSPLDECRDPIRRAFRCP
jgi:hypothetical protein